MRPLLPVLLFVAACARSGGPAGEGTPASDETRDTNSLDTSEGPDEPVDLDGDGWLADDDCDDTDGGVNPDAEEVCNGRDDDCDGAVDGDAVDRLTWYPDQDGDGWGALSDAVLSCAQPLGHVTFLGDCDDADPAVNPEVRETCDGVDSDCDGTEDDAQDAASWFADADADGFGDAATVAAACSVPEGWVADATDCDPARADVFPGAVELCDGLDDDCDGEVDEDATDAPTWHADVDGDGFGDAGTVAYACDAPTGFVADGSDCDDGSAARWPGAAERCDGADDDCDGAADNAAVDAPSWYLDADGDGFGDSSVTACDAPAGHVATDGDCDDTDAEVNPGATEDCEATEDVNCDGSVGLADADGDGAPACEDCDDADASWHEAFTWSSDADGDGYGDAGATSDACWPPAAFVADDTDCDDDDPAVNPGASEVWYDDVDQDCDGGSDWDADGDGYLASEDDCLDSDASVNLGATEVCGNGLDDDCDGSAAGCGPSGTWSLADAGLRMVGESSSDHAGWDVASLSDPWGTGQAALVVGAPFYDASRGSTYLVNASTTGNFSLAGATAAWQGEAAGDYSGYAVRAGGDLDGDGVEDLVIGAYGESTAAAGAGAAYVVSAGATGTLPLSGATAKITGVGASDMAGGSLDVFDADGDGVDDLIVGANAITSGACWYCGAAYIVSGPLTGTVSLVDAATALYGNATNESVGSAFAHGDLYGDGQDVLVIAAFGVAGSQGEVYLVGDLPAGTSYAEDAADFTLAGEAAMDVFGYRVVVPGDVNGDGYDDLLVGMVGDSTVVYGNGVAHLFLGPITEDRVASDADGSVYGTEVRDQAGMLGEAGDVDDDGFDDLLVGAPDTSYADEGRAALVYGPVSGSMWIDDADLLLYGENTNDYAGWALTGVGDADGDGDIDLLVGSYSYDCPADPSCGAAYLWSGTGL